MSESRSPTEFMLRSGIITETRQPCPRLDVGSLLINYVPLEDTQLSTEALQEYQGDPSPDRGPTRPWPSAESE